MADRLRVDLYCEDPGHEQLTRALLSRLAREEGVSLLLQTRNALGGHGRAVSEFQLWQRAASKISGESPPDLLVLVIDANCQGWNQARSALVDAIDTSLFPRFSVGCPDPHVERWCFADAQAYREVIGASPPKDPGKCERELYKKLLRQSILDAGHVILTDPMELAPELVGAMNLFRAGKKQSSLKHFIDELRGAIRSLVSVSDTDPPEP